MTLIDLANPTKFLSLTARVLPWLAGATAILLLIGFYQAAMAPDDYQQGATVKIMFVHVPNAWLCDVRLGRDEPCRAGHAGMAASACRCRGQGGRPDRRGIHLSGAGDGLAVGTADVGHLLGMGCAADLGPDPVPDVSRPDGAVARGGRSVAGGAGRRHPDAGRRAQPADHQILGRLVEHAASAGARCCGWAALRSTRRS